MNRAPILSLVRKSHSRLSCGDVFNLESVESAKTARAASTQQPASAFGVSLAVHGVAAALIFSFPVELVSSAGPEQSGELVSVSFSEPVGQESVAEPEKASPRRAATVVIHQSAIEPEALMTPIQPAEPSPSSGPPLAFVTVPETFEPSLEPNESSQEDSPPEPKSKASEKKAEGNVKDLGRALFAVGRIAGR